MFLNDQRGRLSKEDVAFAVETIFPFYKRPVFEGMNIPFSFDFSSLLEALTRNDEDEFERNNQEGLKILYNALFARAFFLSSAFDDENRTPKFTDLDFVSRLSIYQNFKNVYDFLNSEKFKNLFNKKYVSRYSKHHEEFNRYQPTDSIYQDKFIEIIQATLEKMKENLYLVEEFLEAANTIFDYNREANTVDELFLNFKDDFEFNQEVYNELTKLWNAFLDSIKNTLRSYNPNSLNKTIELLIVYSRTFPYRIADNISLADNILMQICLVAFVVTYKELNKIPSNGEFKNPESADQIFEEFLRRNVEEEAVFKDDNPIWTDYLSYAGKSLVEVFIKAADRLEELLKKYKATHRKA